MTGSGGEFGRCRGRGKGGKGWRIFPRFPEGEDVDREIMAHLEMCAEELVEEGWHPEEARREAARRFGSRTRIRRRCRSIEKRHRKAGRRIEMLGGLLQDLRYGVRTLRKSPGFTVVAVITLALGIGANATVFSIVNGVLLEPLSYENPEELVWVAERTQTGGTNWVAWPNYMDWRAESRTLKALAAYDRRTTTILGGDQPTLAPVASVSQDFWSVFPVKPRAGRLTGPEDHVEGGAPVAVVSEALARQLLGGEGAVGKLIEFSGVWHEVVGVVPPGLDFPSGTHVWTVAERTPKGPSRSSHEWRTVGRLFEGMTAADVEDELDPLTVRLVAPHMGDQGAEWLASGVMVTSLQERIVGDTRSPLFLLLGAAAFVLLVACTNLASTLLARGTTRARELAVRSAIGASQTRIVRQLLSEAALLAVVGGAAGIILTHVTLQGIRAVSAGSVPRMENVSLDGKVLLFTLGVTLLTALAFGLLPALRARENDQAGTLRTEGRGNSGFKGRVWGTLVAAEVALALILLTGSGLLIRSFNAVLAEDAGFDGEDVVFTGVSLSQIKYREYDDHRIFWEDMLARAEALPGVSQAGIITVQPLSGFVPGGLVHLNGDPSVTGNGGYIVVSPGLFEALDITLLRGRTFDETDGPNAPHSAVVNQSFADAHWPGEDPIGKQVSGGGFDNFWDSDPLVFGTVVGVVADVRYRELTRAGEPVVYWNYRQRPARTSTGANLVVESATGDPSVVAASLRLALQEAEPDVAPQIRFMRDMVADDVGDRRFTLLIMTGFAAIGLLLAALGIFGVVSYAVAQRTREMGIRLALGATGGSVRSMVLRGAMVPVGLGLLVGVPGAWALSRIMSGLLYEVAPNDPLTYLGVSTLLLVTGLLASWIPAVRGTRVNPMITMVAGLLVVALAACEPAKEPGILTEFSDSAGVAIAESPGLPEPGAGGWTLRQTPTLSIGTLDGDSLYQLFRVTGAVKLSDGRIAVTENGTHQLRLFAPDGTHHSSFGREGEGPGEFRDITVMGTVGRDTLVVLDGQQRRTSRFHPEVGFLGQTVLPEEAGVAMHSNGMFGDGSIVFGGLVNWDRGDATPLAGYERLTNPFYAVSLDGSGITHFGEFPGTEVVWTTGKVDGRESLAAAFVRFGLSPRAMARGDHLVLGTRDRYEVNVFDSSGALRRIIRVQVPPVPVTEAHLEGLLEEQLARLPSPDLAPQVRAGFREMPHADFMPAFEALILDSEGFLWVEEKNIPGDTLRTWTVFDKSGVPKTRLSLPAANRVLDIGRDFVLAVFRDELDVEFVRVYPLTRGD